MASYSSASSESSHASESLGSASTSENADVGGDLHGEETFALIIEKIAPYLNPSSDKALVKQKLCAAGVETFGDLAHLEYNDVETFMKPIQFRKFLSTLKEESVTITAQNSPKTRNYRLPVHLFSTRELGLRKQLEGSTRLSKLSVLKLVKLIGDDMFDNYGHTFCADRVKKAVASLCGMYPGALGGKFTDQTSTDLINRIRNRITYLQAREVRLSGKQRKPTEKATKQFLIGTSAYGIPSGTDLPTDLPSGETQESQAKKRAQLQQMAVLAEINWFKVALLMCQTYVLQRADINDLLAMEELLELWPFIGKHSILMEHFHFLMDLNIGKISDRMAELFPKVLGFMKAEANAKRKKTDQENTLEENLREIILQYEEGEEVAKRQVMAAIKCILCYLKLDEKQIFMYFDKITSFDEIQACAQLPADGKPVIAVLGSDVITDEPGCFVVVDRRILYRERLTPFEAFMSLFASYYVFKILYPPKVAALLEFLQREVFNIATSDSTKTKTDSTLSPKGRKIPARPVNLKYLSFVRKLEDYSALWTKKAQSE